MSDVTVRELLRYLEERGDSDDAARILKYWDRKYRVDYHPFVGEVDVHVGIAPQDRMTRLHNQEED